MKPALYIMLLTMGCYHPAERMSADGGIEWGTDDGRWLTAGEPCGCENVQSQLYESDPPYRVLLECMPVNSCDGRQLVDGGSDCPAQASVCFGAGCCVWQPGVGNATP